jgi:hypothetical protein
MFISETNNIYHGIITNIVFALLAKNESVFVEDGVFTAWMLRAAEKYQSSMKNIKHPMDGSQCYFGHVYKIIKMIHSTPTIFCKSS